MLVLKKTNPSRPDWPLFGAIASQAFNGWTPAVERYDACHDDHRLLMEGAAAVAIGTITRTDRTFTYLRNIAVAPDRQKRGYGMRLMAAFETAAAALNYKGICLHSASETAGFYERCGYQNYNGIRTETGELLMAKAFSRATRPWDIRVRTRPAIPAVAQATPLFS